jgi:hypothetical protein
MSVPFLWIVTPWGLVGRYQRVSLKCLSLPTSPHSITTQKTNNDKPLFVTYCCSGCVPCRCHRGIFKISCITVDRRQHDICCHFFLLENLFHLTLDNSDNRKWHQIFCLHCNSKLYIPTVPHHIFLSVIIILLDHQYLWKAILCSFNVRNMVKCSSYICYTEALLCIFYGKLYDTWKVFTVYFIFTKVYGDSC